MSKFVKMTLGQFNMRNLAPDTGANAGGNGGQDPEPKKEPEQNKEPKADPAPAPKKEEPKAEPKKEEPKAEPKKIIRKTKAELEAEIKKLQDEYDNYNTDMSEYTTQIDNLNTTVADLQGQITNKDARIAELEAVVNDVVEAKKKTVGDNVLALLPENLSVLDVLKFLTKAEEQQQGNKEGTPKVQIGKIMNVPNAGKKDDSDLSAVQKISNIFGNYFKK